MPLYFWSLAYFAVSAWDCGKRLLRRCESPSVPSSSFWGLDVIMKSHANGDPTATLPTIPFFCFLLAVLSFSPHISWKNIIFSPLPRRPSSRIRPGTARCFPVEPASFLGSWDEELDRNCKLSEPWGAAAKGWWEMRTGGLLLSSFSSESARLSLESFYPKQFVDIPVIAVFIPSSESFSWEGKFVSLCYYTDRKLWPLGKLTRGWW